jgi:iron(III) transport system substrate-binding protein
MALQALVAAARQEGSLSLVWGQGSMGGSEGVARLAEGFNRAYGLNLDVRFTPGPSMPSMAARLADEYTAGRAAASDVLLGYAEHVLILMKAGALEPEDWASWAPNVRDPRSVEAEGRAVTHQSSMPGITYNSNRLSGEAIPRSMADLLKPEYKGRIASTPYAAGFDWLAAPDGWGEQRVKDYLHAFKGQLAGLLRCNEMERVANGEFDILAMQCSQNGPLQAKQKSQPVDFVVPTDAAVIAPLYVAVPKNAAHPNAAKLWVNYLLSREAQDILYETDQADSHWLPGSKTAPVIEQLQAAGARFFQADIAFYQRNDEEATARTWADLEKILAEP